MRRPNPAFYPTQSFDRASNDHIALAMIIGLRETARDRKQPTPPKFVLL